MFGIAPPPPRSGKRGTGQYTQQKGFGQTVGQHRHRGLAGRGAFHERNDFRKTGVFANGSDLDAQGCTQVMASRKHRHAHGSLEWVRLAGK